MAKAALVGGWTDTKQGREKLAGELFGTTMAQFAARVEDGTFESFEPVILHRHGGDLNGFVIIRGDQEKLDAWQRTDEYLDWVTSSIHCLSGFGVIGAYVGDAVGEIMARWAAKIPE